MTRPTERLAAIEARVPIRIARGEHLLCVASSGGRDCGAAATWVPPSYAAGDGDWDGDAWCDEHVRGAS